MDYAGIIGQVFWLIFIIAFFLPIFRQRALMNARIRLIHDLERRRRSRVIVMIHRQEQMAFLGFPLFRYINIEDSEEILRAIRLTPPDMPIDLVLHTPGGLVLASEQIALAIKAHKAKVTIFVPHYAMSGGTLVALAADEIVMDKNAVLGPIDPQLGEYPAASVLTVIERKAINEIDDRTLILADVAVKAQKQVRYLVRRILDGKMPPAQADEVAKILTEGRWTHDYPITIEEAEMLKLHVTIDMPNEVYSLMKLYPQPGAHRPSVEYIPVPYERPTVPPARRSRGHG
ncbi:MAG: ATP-dependent Clp protease proteolytic subunit [Armatimonadota bacterium]